MTDRSISKVALIDLLLSEKQEKIYAIYLCFKIEKMAFQENFVILWEIQLNNFETKKWKKSADWGNKVDSTIHL